MDVNVALDEMRAAIKTLHGGIAPLETIQLLELIAGRAEAIDGWLSMGGFLPSSWADIAEPVKL